MHTNFSIPDFAAIPAHTIAISWSVSK